MKFSTLEHDLTRRTSWGVAYERFGLPLSCVGDCLNLFEVNDLGTGNQAQVNVQQLS